MKWTEETPTVEGWYWMKYKNKRNKYTICPGELIILKRGVLVNSAKNDTFIKGPDHGGGEYFSCNAKLDKSVRFGTLIPFEE